jgi:hypothetical protein
VWVELLGENDARVRWQLDHSQNEVHCYAE